MSVLSDLAAIVKLPGARILAMDPKGGQTVALPEGVDVGRAAVMTVDGPLDPIAAAFHGSAVAAFEAATRRGHGSAIVALTDTTESHRLHIFNLEQEHGCFLAVAVLDITETLTAGTTDSVAPRQSSFTTGASGVFVSVEHNLTLMLGWSAEELIGKSVLDFVHPDDHEDAIISWIEMLENPTRPCRVRQRFMTKSGGWLWCDATDTNHLDDEINAHVRAEVVDVSREMAAQAALQQRETLLDRLTQTLPSGVLQLDADGTAQVWNDRWPDLTGADPADGTAGLVSVIVEADHVGNAIKAAITDGVDADVEVSFANVAGVCQFGNLHIRPLRQDDLHMGLLMTLDDVTSLRTYQYELAEKAQRDALTGVLNRFGLEKALEERMETVRQTAGSDLAVLFLDLDRFKAINDQHGHATGDAVLCHVADAVAALLRPNDVIGRLGGDEFLVMMVCENAAEQSAMITERICRAVAAVADQVPEDLTVGVTTGSAIAIASDDFDSLIRRADEAMYTNKRIVRSHTPIPT